MKSVILCEGKTDAILLSLYLERVSGWLYHKPSKQDALPTLPLRGDAGEEANWYHVNREQHLVIWAVGGQSELPRGITEILSYNTRVATEEAFSQLIILTDRDTNETDAPILQSFTEHMTTNGLTAELENNKWVPGAYISGFEEQATLNVLTLIVPFEEQGALETFLLNALAERTDDDTAVVAAARKFVDELKSDKYLPSNRLRLKAKLATAFAIFSPERVFTDQRTLLNGIPWESYKTIREGFHLLEQIRK